MNDFNSKKEDEISVIVNAILSKLEERRREYGLTQMQLAKMLGMEQSRISKWEKGVDQISLASFVRYATILAFDMAKLLRDMVK